jgi:hypothetical protein
MKAKITFTKCVQDVQDVAIEQGKEDRMVSRLFFTLDAFNAKYEMQMEIRQPHGFDFSDADTCPIEASLPKGGFNGPWHYESLNAAAEKYYRTIIGSNGRAINYGPGVSTMRMRNNTINLPQTHEIELPDKGGSW